MRENNANETSTTEISADDPRYGYAMTTAALHPVIEGSLDQLNAPTPCPEFTVRDLLDHLVMVQQRVALIGNGGDFATIDSPELDSGWDEAFLRASQDVRAAWEDGAKLEQMFQVPWGESPGAPALLMYTAELATHGWDLATATGQTFEVDDDHLRGALVAAQFVPADKRDDSTIPFGPVTTVASDAPAVEQIAAWFGRSVS